MISQRFVNSQSVYEAALAEDFLSNPGDGSFTALFQVFFPQLVAFFRSRVREVASAEDLSQEVMMTVYRKAGQIRDRALFRAWLFRVARNALCRHYGRATGKLETVSLEELETHGVSTREKSAGTHGFELRDCMRVLDWRERDIMILRFLDHWKYREIAAASCTPIGTVQWRVFNAKKKLAAYLTGSPHTNCPHAGGNQRNVKQSTVRVTAA